MWETLAADAANDAEQALFERAYLGAQRPITRFLAGFLRTTADRRVEDLYHEVMLRAWVWRRRIRPPYALPWLYRVAHSVLVDDRRRSLHIQPVALPAISLASPAETESDDEDSSRPRMRYAVDGWLGPTLEPLDDDGAVQPELAAMREEQREALALLIAALPADSREILTLHYLRGVPMREVAERLHLAYGTCKTRASRGRAAARRLIANGGILAVLTPC